MEIINLDMTPSTVTPNAHAGQYDSARIVRFMLKNGGVPFTLAGTETITAEITRSDNTEVTVNVANTSSNYVDVVFDDTACTVKGLYACELRLKDSDGFDIGSKNFALLVQRDPYDGAGVRVETIGPADICTFETTLAEPLQSVIVDVEATGGNGTPDNPNPINGYTEANITRCGVNLWDEEWELGTINDNTGALVPNSSIIRSKNFIPVSGGVTILLYATSTSNMWMRVFEYDKNENFIASDAKYTGSTYQLNANTAYLKFYMKSDYGTTYNNDISINYPSTDTAYHPYNGQTYTIAFGQTVYGGVLDVTRGKLKPCIEYPSYNGETLSGRWLSSEATYVEGTTPPTGSQVVSLDDYGTDIDLTPEVISAVVGENNVFGDCGQTEVKYLKAGA